MPEPGHRPTSASTFPAATLATGLGETAGDAEGIAVGAGRGDAGGLTSVVVLHADAAIMLAVKVIQNPQSKIPNRDDLLNVFIFIVIGQSHP